MTIADQIYAEAQALPDELAREVLDFIGTMLTSVQISLEEVQSKLPEIIHGLGEGDEVVIVEGKQTVARLLGPPPAKRGPRMPGSARGKLTVLAEDEEYLKDFGKYIS